MRIQENKINNQKVIRIFLSKEEENDKVIKRKIHEIEERGTNVVLFISGDEEINRTLQKIIKIIKNESIRI